MTRPIAAVGCQQSIKLCSEGSHLLYRGVAGAQENVDRCEVPLQSFRQQWMHHAALPSKSLSDRKPISLLGAGPVSYFPCDAENQRRKLTHSTEIRDEGLIFFSPTLLLELPDAWMLTEPRCRVLKPGSWMLKIDLGKGTPDARNSFRPCTGN
jgi:hypothetical protein